MFSDQYRKVRLIGKGAFGEAWKVESRRRGGVFIMKEISVRGMSERDLQMGKNEIEILRNCHNDNIVGYVDDFYEQGKFLIVMEFCEGGDLAGFIQRQRRHLPEDHVRNWLGQMVSGLHYIHDQNILHRDLKPANIFLTSDQQLKIGDFGISKSLDQTRQMAQTYCGTPVYMAPEVLLQYKFMLLTVDKYKPKI